MSLTWRDGVTTVAIAAAVAIERAFNFNWDWPLISNIDWAIAGVAALTAVGFIFSYALDAVRGMGWSIVVGLFGISAALLSGLGFYYHDTDYVVMLMLNAVLFWVASMVRHLTVDVPATRSHA